LSIANERKDEKGEWRGKKREKARNVKHECEKGAPVFPIFRLFSFVTMKGKYKEMMQKG
jgi:hypothetical protein